MAIMLIMTMLIMLIMTIMLIMLIPESYYSMMGYTLRWNLLVEQNHICQSHAMPCHAMPSTQQRSNHVTLHQFKPSLPVCRLCLRVPSFQLARPAALLELLELLELMKHIRPI